MQQCYTMPLLTLRKLAASKPAASTTAPSKWLPRACLLSLLTRSPLGWGPIVAAPTGRPGATAVAAPMPGSTTAVAAAGACHLHLLLFQLLDFQPLGSQPLNSQQRISRPLASQPLVCQPGAYQTYQPLAVHPAEPAQPQRTDPLPPEPPPVTQATPAWRCRLPRWRWRLLMWQRQSPPALQDTLPALLQDGHVLSAQLAARIPA